MSSDDHDEPNVEAEPKIPPSIAPDVFFGKMTERQQLEHLQDSLYQAALVRRDHRQNGPKEKVSYQSNYRNLLGMIEAPMKSSGNSSVKVGTIMNAIKQAKEHQQQDHDGHDGSNLSGGSTPRHYEHLERSDEAAYEKMRKGVVGRDQGRSFGAKVAQQFQRHNDSNASPMRHGSMSFVDQRRPIPATAPPVVVPKDVVDKAKVAMTTLSRQKELETAQVEEMSAVSLRDSMRGAMRSYRAQNKRRGNSYPRAMYSVVAYSDYQELYNEGRLEVRRLKKVCDGMGPRDQERKLQSKIDVLESQIVNQLALIKGLREKLKILREQGTMHNMNNPIVSLNASMVLPGLGGAQTLSTPQQTSFSSANVLMSHVPQVVEETKHVTEPLTPLQQNMHTVPSSRQRLGEMLHILNSTPMGPRGDSCTVCVVDLDAGKYLWESFPETLRSQTEILHRMIRQDAAKWRGYEALNRDDKFMFAFSSPFDACQFALDLNSNLVQAEWAGSLSDAPETATEYIQNGASKGQYLWRGLRLRIGIETSAQALTDPIFPLRTTYEGIAIEVADYLQKLSLGGEILISSSVFDGIIEHLDRLGKPIVEEWGNITYHPCRASVRRITPKLFAERIPYFNRAISTAERQLHEEAEDPEQFLHPPVGKIIMVTILCPVMPMLKTLVSDHTYRDTMQRAFHCVTSLSRSEGGYISQMNLDGMAFVVTFDESFAALKFALDFQQHMNEQDWSQELLRVPNCSTVRIRDKVIYNGLRAQVGIHQFSQPAVTFREPMESRMQYKAKDSKVSSLMAAAAVDGEVVISDALLYLITERYDELGCPVSDYVADIPTPISDTLLRMYHVFSDNLKERGPFVSRDFRLKDENQELANAGVVDTFRKQSKALQSKLEEKNEWIKRLYAKLDERTEAIKGIREHVLKTPFLEIDVPITIASIDSGFQFGNETILLAISFANPEELFELEPQLMPDSLEIFEDMLDRNSAMFDGREVRRLPSRIARIISFSDPHKAMAFWCHILKTTNDEDWPLKLDDSMHAALMMASELFPGLQPDVIVWKGLRPVCAMHSANSPVRFNTLTRAYEVIGDDVNLLAEMVRCAGPGDCLVSPRFASIHRVSVERINTDLQFNEYGPFVRCLDTSNRFRTRAMSQSFPPIKVNELPKPKQIAAMVVHVIIQDSVPDIQEQFPLDCIVFNETVMQCAIDFNGMLMASLQSEFAVLFPNPHDGSRFAVHLHSYLLRANWTREVRRLMDFLDLTRDDKVLFRGVRAKVGCHWVSELNEVLDFFSGKDQWFHAQMNIAFVLALRAHAGETLATDAAMDKLRISFKEKKVDFFAEPCGLAKVDSSLRKDPIFQVLPTPLIGRVAYFLEEDMRFNSAEEMSRRQKERRVYRKKREKTAAGVANDTDFFASCDRNKNPFDDPIHRKTCRLFTKIRQQVDEERSRFHTCMETMSLIETCSMMAEDQLFLGDPDNGKPYYAHLMLHEMENGRYRRDTFYKKDLAAQLLGNALVEPPRSLEVLDVELQLEGRSEEAATNGSDTAKSPTAQKVPQGSFSSLSCTAITPSNRLRKTVFSTNFNTISVQPEDVVLLHIDVERFYQLLKLYGLDSPMEFALEFMTHAYQAAFPDLDPGEFDDNVKWDRICALSSVTGMDLCNIDIHKLRCSVLANLCLAYQEVAHIEW